MYSELLAAMAGWDRVRVGLIRSAATLHDLGKTCIPEGILRKPGKLTPGEISVVRTHTLLGAAMLAGSSSPLLRMAGEIALGHHEHWDGGGYPSGLSGYAIPESARIVAIVDVFDALTHDRVYRRALPEPEVIGLMWEGRGRQFDPHLLGLFMGQFPAMRAIARGASGAAGGGGSPRVSAAHPPPDLPTSPVGRAPGFWRGPLDR
jgi:putative two-component system response regulator